MTTTHEEGWFTAADGRPIFHRAVIPAKPKGIVLLVHGLHEHSRRYEPVMAHLAGRGFAVFAPDHRGHGRSARTLGDLEGMDLVLADLAVLHRDVALRFPKQKVFLLGHSMGGLISVLYAERTPGLAGAVLNGSALDVPDDVPVAVQKAAGVLGRLAPRLPIQPFYAPQELTHDPAVLADVEADPLFYKGRLRARTGAELLKSIRRAVAGLPQLTLPILVTHGERDSTVPLRASEALFGGAASADKTFRVFAGLLHEVHNELPPARDEVLAVWTSWLEAHR